jgi:hypothetical protein
VFRALTSGELFDDEPDFSVERFRRVAEDRLGFLSAYGFHRATELEDTMSALGTYVLLGRHVGFVFSVDLRDLAVGADVVKVVDGQVNDDNMAGGYCSDIYGHLITHEGYRGRQSGPRDTSPSDSVLSPLEYQVEGWARLLRHAGQRLLADDDQSLPPLADR